ncbi:hypothetical protein IMCC9480_1576 [Oxalobacteraceae bacterium IMCC9480]|nr:hypothetical protein IMCC9480_1576 [Oxalobacteraceae bacterium IMCC9480]
MQDVVGGTNIVFGEQVSFAAGDIATRQSAAAAIEDAAVRRGNEGRVAIAATDAAGADLVDQQVAGQFDQVSAERAVRGQRAAAAGVTGIDIDVIAGCTDGSEVGRQRDVAGADIDTRTRRQIAAVIAGIDNRHMRAQADVAGVGGDAIEVHVAQCLVQPDAGEGMRGDGAGAAEVGLEHVAGAADAATGSQFDALAGDLRRVAVGDAVEEGAGRCQVHDALHRRDTFDQHVAAGFADGQVIQGARGQRRVGSQVQRERCRHAADRTASGFQDQVAADDIDAAGGGIDDAVLAFDAGIGGGDDVLDIERQGRAAGTQIHAAGVGGDIDLAAGVDIDVVALVDHHCGDGRSR